MKPALATVVSKFTYRTTPMLAEKFILLLETLRSQSNPDGAPRVISTSPHIPVKLPSEGAKPR